MLTKNKTEYITIGIFNYLLITIKNAKSKSNIFYEIFGDDGYYENNTLVFNNNPSNKFIITLKVKEGVKYFMKWYLSKDGKKNIYFQFLNTNEKKLELPSDDNFNRNIETRIEKKMGLMKENLVEEERELLTSSINTSHVPTNITIGPNPTMMFDSRTSPTRDDSSGEYLKVGDIFLNDSADSANSDGFSCEEGSEEGCEEGSEEGGEEDNNFSAIMDTSLNSKAIKEEMTNILTKKNDSDDKDKIGGSLPHVWC